MDIYDFYDSIKEYAKDSDGYAQWRKIHGEAFGRIFLSAFEENEDAQLFLTSALTAMSKKDFEKSEQILTYLYDLCNNDYDNAAICYFSGLNYEFKGEAEKMSRCYEELQSFGIAFHYNIIFHPYYRTAKLKAKEAECQTALSYYKKVLSFYNEKELNEEQKKIFAQVYSDMPAVFLYTHRYSEAIAYLKKSFTFDESDIEQRNFCIAILNAIEGREDEVREIIKKLSPLLSRACSIMTQNIMNNKDPHYCAVTVNRFAYLAAIKRFKTLSEEAVSLVKADRITEAEKKLSSFLTKLFPFMKRELACRIIKSDDCIIAECKNYYVRTLIAEYEYLFDVFNRTGDKLRLVSVNEYEGR